MSQHDLTGVNQVTGATRARWRMRVQARWLARLAHGFVSAAMLISTVVAGLPNAVAMAQPADARMFPQTGYRVDNDAFWDYFQRRGGVTTFGYPSSHEFRFLGCASQFFQRLVMQRCVDGGVTTLNLLDEGLLPYTQMDGSTFPGPSPELTAAAPKPDDPNYGSDVIAFVRANAPDTFENAPVNFGRTFFSSISPDLAGTDDSSILALLDLEIWGLPTSQPAFDPSNRNFIYQRFQRGIMHYDSGCSCTRGLLLADYLKMVLTGQGLPADLEAQAADSPLLRSVVNGRVPDGTDYTGAFDGVEVGGVQVSGPVSTGSTPTSTPTAVPTSTPQPTSTGIPTNTPTPRRASDSQQQPTATPQPTSTPESPLAGEPPPPGSVSKSLVVTEPIDAAGNCDDPSIGAQQPLFLEAPSNDAAQGIGFNQALGYPALPIVCFASAPSRSTIQISVSTSAGVVATDSVTPSASGWTWRIPDNGTPPQPGAYKIMASQAGQTSATPAAVATATVTVEQPGTTNRILVVPRYGPPGTVFRIFIGGFPTNKPDVFLRLYRCSPQGSPPTCTQSVGATHVYAASLGPIATDRSGFGSFTLVSRATDPKTGFVVLSDQMYGDGRAGVFNRGLAWFCTTLTGCKTQ
jgi:hypothetical protein